MKSIPCLTYLSGVSSLMEIVHKSRVAQTQVYLYLIEMDGGGLGFS